MNTPILTDEQIKTFQQNGFVKGGRVLSDDEVEELREELDRVVRERDDESIKQPVRTSVWGEQSGKPVWQIVNIWEVSSAYERLMHHPFIVDAISRLTGADELMVWHDQIQHKPAGHGGVTGWHQDAPLWPIIRPMTPVSAWVALDDATVENGCMWMTPGSHS